MCPTSHSSERKCGGVNGFSCEVGGGQATWRYWVYWRGVEQISWVQMERRSGVDRRDFEGRRINTGRESLAEGSDPSGREVKLSRSSRSGEVVTSEMR